MLIFYTQKQNERKLKVERDFKGVWIPKEIWLDDRLNALDKIIFVEIDSLCSEERGCFASNKYLADFCQCSETKISKAISKLIDLEYLYVVSFNGRQRELQSCLAKNARQNNKKCKADEQKVQGSIYIDNNNKVNNKDNKVSKEVSKEVENEEKNKTYSTRKSYDEIIEEYTDNEELRLELKAFLQIIKLKNISLTNRAFKLLLADLNMLAAEDYHKIRIIQKALVNGRTSFEALSEKEEEALFRMHKWEQKYGKDFLKNTLNSD